MASAASARDDVLYFKFAHHEVLWALTITAAVAGRAAHVSPNALRNLHSPHEANGARRLRSTAILKA